MKIVIKTTKIDLDDALRAYLEEKINSLERYLKIFQDETYYDGFFGKGKPKVEAWVEVERTTQHHRQGPIFRVECQMRFPQKSLRAESVQDDLKLAITEAKDELQRQIKQYKEKLKARNLRGVRAMKKDLKLSPAARFWRKGRIREEGI
ncbi:MAG: ribosome hibernation-promoting factor, HPF/YfiA family [Minisyncoccales bacterium]